MSHAQELINAVQSCEPQRLRAVIGQLERLADMDVSHLKPEAQLWSRKTYINDQLSGDLDLTALHVAAKAYAAHEHDARLAGVFNTMVADLLEAGASPFVEARVGTNRGQTVPEVCEGKMPPALSEWIAERCDDNRRPYADVIQHPAMRKANAIRVEKLKARCEGKQSGLDSLAQVPKGLLKKRAGYARY